MEDNTMKKTETEIENTVIAPKKRTKKTEPKTPAVERVDNNLTEMIFILDKSGSMSGLEGDTVGGFNSMIGKQKETDGRALVTTVLFDTDFSTLHDRVDLSDVPQMTKRDYVPGGCTALYDAVGCTVNRISDIRRYLRPEDVPSKTVVIITTDGYENSSREFGREDVKRLISRKREEGWEFIFLGANIDAETTAVSLGISRSRAAKYKADAAGTAVNFEAMSDVLCSVREDREISDDWKAKIVENEKKGRTV